MDSIFLNEISEISSKYNLDSADKFNIFSVLHKHHDERRLHSRFLSNLLSPNSNHGEGTLFLEKFIEHLNSHENNPSNKIKIDFENITVSPNEIVKSEWKNLDIYIRDKKNAIIVENKIFAGDSNFISATNEVIPQLLNYFEKAKIDLNIEEHQALKNITLVYLTLDKKNPSLFDSFNERGVTLITIDYIQFIQGWLDECQSQINNSNLKASIQQYKSLLIELTNDFKLAIELKDLISENIDKAYLLIKSDNSQSMILKEQIVHIRWHTIFDFWNELGLKIEQKFKIKVNLPSNDLITKTTHRNRKKGIDLNFTFNDIFIYVVNDRKGLTFGLVQDNQKDWEYFKFENSKSILFHDFDSIETFRIINSEYRNQVTDNIVLELGNKIEERVRSVVLKTNLISLSS